MRKFLLLGLLLFLAGKQMFAQGVTTATIAGIVLDQNNQPLPGSNILAVHTPSGSEYGTAARPDGRFTIVNARVGGPYLITVSFVGYETISQDNIYLSLGNTTDLQFQLRESGTQLEEVEITSSSLFNADRTGAASNINNRTIQSIPTINRGLRDFTKLSPLASTAGNGTSFAGSNNRYNQFAIDGLVNNDVYGLAASGTNGGQTGIEPISLDAIEEFQINVAPYDVRQGGFTGGGINAVTRSGSNKFQGSVYYFLNNENFVGKTNPNSGAEQKYPEYKDYQAGIRLGGPIIKNKLFFFVNGEITRSKTPLSFEPGSAESNITIDEVERVINTLETLDSDFNPGGYLGIADELNSNKWLAKLDWNINQNHKLTVRHSYTYGENIDNSRSPNALRFYNNGVYFPTTTNSTGIELNSVLGTNISNRLLVGRTSVRDDRDPLGDPFPYTLINLTNGRSIAFGSENSSVANQLDQDNYTLTNDLTIFKGSHTITIGTHNEFYKFYNLFVQNIYGNYAFNSIEAFESQATDAPIAPTFYRVGYSFADDGPQQVDGAAAFNAFQLGLYGQDEWQFSDRLKLVAGLRMDLPIFPDKPEANAAFNDAYGEQGRTGEVPDSKVLFSPRAGFNLDVFGNKDTQVRGGLGLFTGRVPFVWVSNQYSNNGQLNGTYSVGNSSSSGTPLTNGVTYNVNPYSQPLPGSPPLEAVTPGRGAINVIDPDFRFPQVFRSNLAVDKQLPWGLTATIEAIFSKTYNNVNFTNLNRQAQDNFTFAGPDKRPRFTTTSTSPTASGYNSAGRIDPNFEEIVKLENTDKGYSYNFVFQLQKQLSKGFSSSVSYTYGDSRDLNSGASSVAYSNWQFVNNVNGLNSLPLTRSNYSMGSRVVGLVSYRKEYAGGHAATQVSLFYNGQSGQPFSYRYNGDLNYDGTSNDLIYVPADASEINLVSYNITVDGNQVTVSPEEQWAALDKFIETDRYLRTRRGQYAERNGVRMPFQHQFDLRLLQEFGINAGNSSNKLQLSVDILNVGNLFNSDWGKQYTIANQEFALINYLGLRDDDPAGNAVDYSANTPRFTYNAGGQTNNKAWSANDFLSRWRMQLGVRYIFE
jgi:hypothetical protein